MKEELIRFRQKKAKETLEDATILLNSGRLFSALNRIYYALFYEVSALLSLKTCLQESILGYDHSLTSIMLRRAKSQ